MARVRLRIDCFISYFELLRDDLYHKAPPVPQRLIATDGRTLFAGQEIKDGQNVWQSTGGQEVGTVWGHGSYAAPDWTADWLHLESEYMLDKLAQQTFRSPYKTLLPEQQAQLQKKLQLELRTNTYDAASGTLTISPLRAEAVEAASRHYAGLFMNDTSLAKLRNAYSIPANSVKDPQRMRLMNGFFFWASGLASPTAPVQT